jgi:hypothetical protein
MIETEKFAKLLTEKFDFFIGAPDSLLKFLYAYLTAHLECEINFMANIK